MGENKALPNTDREITEAMIDAGVAAFRDWDNRIEEAEGLVISIYLAMANRASRGER